MYLCLVLTPVTSPTSSDMKTFSTCRRQSYWSWCLQTHWTSRGRRTSSLPSLTGSTISQTTARRVSRWWVQNVWDIGPVISKFSLCGMQRNARELWTRLTNSKLSWSVRLVWFDDWSDWRRRRVYCLIWLGIRPVMARQPAGWRRSLTSHVTWPGGSRPVPGAVCGARRLGGQWSLRLGSVWLRVCTCPPIQWRKGVHWAFSPLCCFIYVFLL